MPESDGSVTDQVQALIDATGHAAGGLPGERLLRKVGVGCSADTILRHLKRRAAANPARHPVRVVGIDDWAARKGHNYGTIIVDLERREVVDVLQVRSARSAARWFRDHPEIQVVTRDRCGLYARAADERAPPTWSRRQRCA